MNIRHILRESVRKILNEQTAEQRVNKKLSENNGTWIIQYLEGSFSVCNFLSYRMRFASWLL